MLKPVRLLSSVALLALALSGCGALPGIGTPPLDTFELTAPHPDEGRRRGGIQLLIAEPSALKAAPSTQSAWL